MCSEQQASSIAKFSFCTVREAKQAAQGPTLHFRGLKRLVTHCGNWVHRRPSELAAAASTGCRPQIPSQQPNESLLAWIGMQCEGVICPVLKGKLRGELEESAFLIQIFKSHSPSAGQGLSRPAKGPGSHPLQRPPEDPRTPHLQLKRQKPSFVTASRPWMLSPSNHQSARTRPLQATQLEA